MTLSAGLLVYRLHAGGAVEVLLAHPGGPFWARRDAGAWSVPKGECGDDEDANAAARREFREELGHEPPAGPWLDLGEVRQAGGKRVRAWAVEGDLDPSRIASNTFELEWPRGSGRTCVFPEVDRVAWLTPDAARVALVPGQVPLLDRLLAHLREQGRTGVDDATA